MPTIAPTLTDVQVVHAQQGDGICHFKAKQKSTNKVFSLLQSTLLGRELGALLVEGAHV